MKILLLSNPGSPHTLKWSGALAQRRHKVEVVGLNRFAETDYTSALNYSAHEVKLHLPGTDRRGLWNLFSYPEVIRNTKEVIRTFAPDIVHAHYATSYGLVGRLSGFHPLIISVWGTDVFVFPRKSFIHRRFLTWNLSGAEEVLSTSKVMMSETKQYLPAGIPIQVTPFGVDTEVFRPEPRRSSSDTITIGTVKILSHNYGIDTLIRSFHLLKQNHPLIPLRLVIGGEGRDEGELKALVSGLKLDGSVSFLGRINHSNIPDVLRSIDIFAALSLSESFGVSVVEASACELPVVTSDAGGLPEVVGDGETGIVVPKNNPHAAYKALERLVLDANLRKQMGAAGRKRVLQRFDWTKNVELMCSIYEEVLHRAR